MPEQLSLGRLSFLRNLLQFLFLFLLHLLKLPDQEQFVLKLFIDLDRLLGALVVQRPQL